MKFLLKILIIFLSINLSVHAKELPAVEETETSPPEGPLSLEAIQPLAPQNATPSQPTMPPQDKQQVPESPAITPENVAPNKAPSVEGEEKSEIPARSPTTISTPAGRVSENSEL